MSGHSTYQPTNGFTRWLESRLPIMGLMHSSFVSFPTPKNLNYLYTFGGILSMCLVVQLITGIVLAMHYTPHSDFAFASVEHIMRDVNYGWLMRYLHANGASMFFIAVYIHMFRGLYYGSYKAPREVLWIIGVLIYLAMMATGFMGYVLPWGQMSFWGAKVITNLFSAIPFVGESVVVWLWGGFSVDNPTLNRFFSLHYLLPFVIAGLVVLHIWALHVVGNNNPLGVDVKSEKDTVPFTPFYTVKDGFAMVCFIIFFAYFVFFNPNLLGHTDNYIEANPLVTPAHIVPEWYYLPFYAILRAIPDKLGGVLAMFAAIGVLFLLPWLDTSKVRSATFRPMFRQFFFGFVLVCFGLGWVGSQSPDRVLMESSDTESFASREAAEQAMDVLRAQIAEMKKKGETPGFEIKLESSISGHSVKKIYSSFTMLHLGRILTALYFLFFFPLLPLLGLLEKPKIIPASINDAVLAKSKTAGGGAAGAAASGATTAPDKNA